MLGGGGHHEAVERLGHFDLARQARIWPHVGGEIEHVLLHLRRLADGLRPFVSDVDVTGGAGAGAAALGFDAGDAVAQRRLHHRRADLGVDRARRAREASIYVTFVMGKNDFYFLAHIYYFVIDYILFYLFYRMKIGKFDLIE